MLFHEVAEETDGALMPPARHKQNCAGRRFGPRARKRQTSPDCSEMLRHHVHVHVHVSVSSSPRYHVVCSSFAFKIVWCRQPSVHELVIASRTGCSDRGWDHNWALAAAAPFH